MQDIIPFSEKLGYSSFFVDFVNGTRSARDFLAAGPFDELPAKLDEKSYPRAALSDLLQKQNRAWHAPTEVFDSIEKLAGPDSLVVATGQQACLFGGPSLVMFKALTAIKRARVLEQELDRPVVPLFWIVADDHDFKEISTVQVFDIPGEPVRLAVDTPEGGDSIPVGALTCDASVDREIMRLKDILPDNDFKASLLSSLWASYKPGHGYVDAFAFLLHQFFGPFGLVLLNPFDSEFKSMAEPFFEQVLSRHGEIKDALAKTNDRLQADGYHLQVRKDEASAHLFRNAPRREPIRSHPGGFAAGAVSGSIDRWLEMIHQRPADFSPDVFTRPVLQSYLFPVISMVGGPAEIAYYAQMMPLFDLFGMPRPETRFRLSATLIEQRWEKIFAAYHLRYEDLFENLEERIAEILMADYPKNIGAVLAETRSLVAKRFERLQTASSPLDQRMAEAAGRTGEKIDFEIREMEKKLAALHRKKGTEERERFLKFRAQLVPSGVAAERSIGWIYFVSRYGGGLIDYVFERLDSNVAGHQLIGLSEYHG